MNEDINLKTRLLSLKVISNILDVLKEKLPANLYYHNYSHTLDVIDEAFIFATADGLTEREIELLLIAAAYHDSGFINLAKENEALGSELAVKALQLVGGYTRQESDLIKTMILDTTVRSTKVGFKQVPSTELSKYLLDADVSNLGREDFFEKGELVRKELGNIPKTIFYNHSLSLMKVHQWYTSAAKKLRQSQKEKNIAKLETIRN
ncbi:MAG: hypothetical protein SGJ02_14520 [bacterium]|nr:hypothetical protein [bacterium]